MSELIRMLRNEGLATPIQVIVLVIDGYLISSGNVGGFASVSIVIILSTFVLQAVRGRFLLLYPRNNWAGRESSEIDTYYLRSIIIAVTLFTIMALFFGLLETPDPRLSQLDAALLRPDVLVTLAVLFDVLIPFMFGTSFNTINDRIAKKLKNNGPWISLSKCPFCRNSFAVEIHEIVNRSQGYFNLKCESCGKVEMHRVSLNIGEV